MKRWTDEELCAKNGITADAIAFIEKVIRPKDLNGDDSDE
jgi:site-specific DNA-methyltransferase (adenine-specific)